MITLLVCVVFLSLLLFQHTQLQPMIITRHTNTIIAAVLAGTVTITILSRIDSAGVDLIDIIVHIVLFASVPVVNSVLEVGPSQSASLQKEKKKIQFCSKLAFITHQSMVSLPVQICTEESFSGLVMPEREDTIIIIMPPKT